MDTRSTGCHRRSTGHSSHHSRQLNFARHVYPPISIWPSNRLWERPSGLAASDLSTGYSSGSEDFCFIIVSRLVLHRGDLLFKEVSVSQNSQIHPPTC